MTTGFAQSDVEARARYAKYSSLDPYPEIPGALLNSADIADYVRETGMLFPFPLDRGRLKTASYEIDFVGDVFLWKKDSGEPEKVTVGGNGLASFTLPRNSIYFFAPSVLFQIPVYIALRFNLRIKYVHRGLLLGTGPLIDPGFQGQLLIPLHNLTSTDCVIEAGKGLIWVEFTKLSPPPTELQRSGDGDHLPRTGPTSEFPREKKNRPPKEYLSNAAPHDAIQSSVLDIEQRVNEAEATLERYKKIGWWTIIVSSIGLAITILGIVIPALSAVQDANKYVREAEKSISDSTDAKAKGLESRIDSIDTKVKGSESRIGKLEEAERSREQLQQRARAPEKAITKNP